MHNKPATYTSLIKETHLLLRKEWQDRLADAKKAKVETVSGNPQRIAVSLKDMQHQLDSIKLALDTLSCIKKHISAGGKD